jgi:2-methylcitrate dehydratase PrpD
MRIEKNFPAEWPTVVSVRLKNGTQFEKHVRFPKGDPENPLTWQELSAKFQSLAERVFPATRCAQISDSVRNLNSSAKLADIWKLTSRPDSLSLPAN